MLKDISVVSGFGQAHTDEPNKQYRKPYVTISWEAIKQLVDNPQQVEKDAAQWLIPSSLPRRNFKQQEINGEFWLLWADIDVSPPPLNELAMIVDAILGGAQFETYTSHSATVYCQKARILVPLPSPLSGSDWKAAQAAFNDALRSCGITPDDANERTAQLCFLPNCGEFYASNSNRMGPYFQPLVVWSNEIAERRREAERKAAEREARRKAAAERRKALTADDLANSLIHAFNLAYEVEEILLRAGYDEDDNGKFRHPESESGSFSASVLNGRVHSLSSRDPLYTGENGGAHDAYSAFTVLFAGGDPNEAACLAGDEWLTINGESWNLVKRREYAREKAQGAAKDGFEALPDSESPRERFTLLTVQELAALPVVRWRIKGVLPESGIGAIYGPPGSGKSFLALDMLAAIAAGREWFGYKAKPANVTYIGLEGEAGIAARVNAWQKAHGTLPDNFRTILSGLDIRKDADRVALIAALQGAGMGGGVVAIDTLNRATPGADENSSVDMGLAIEGLKHLQRELGGTVCLVHHSGKDASKGLRGHSSLLAALDASLEVERKDKSRTWRVAKSKDGTDGKFHAFTLETILLGADDDLDPVTSCVIRPAEYSPPSRKPKEPAGKNQKLAWHTLSELFDLLILDKAERPRVEYEIAISAISEKMPERGRERAKEAVRGLVSSGFVEHADDYLLQAC